MPCIPIRFSSFWYYILILVGPTVNVVRLSKSGRIFKKVHQTTQNHISKGNILWNPYNFSFPFMSCHSQRMGDRERERERDFTSNCEQKNISQAQLLTFLVLLALYRIKFLTSRRREPWFLIQHDDDDGARKQNYWKYLIKKYLIYVLLPSKLPKKKSSNRLFPGIIQVLWRIFPNIPLWLIIWSHTPSSKFQCLSDPEIQLKL